MCLLLETLLCMYTQADPQAVAGCWLADSQRGGVREWTDTQRCKTSAWSLCRLTSRFRAQCARCQRREDRRCARKKRHPWSGRGTAYR
eukprot:3865821-Rhodomonas_salina.1